MCVCMCVCLPPSPPWGWFVTQIYSSLCYLTPKSVYTTTHNRPLHLPLHMVMDGPWRMVLDRRGGGKRGRTAAVKSLLSADQASACLVMCCHWPIRKSRSNRRREWPPRCPSLSTLLFLIEHICGMRGFPLEGAMAADTSELLTQDQSTESGYQTICRYEKKDIPLWVMPVWGTNAALWRVRELFSGDECPRKFGHEHMTKWKICQSITNNSHCQFYRVISSFTSSIILFKYIDFSQECAPHSYSQERPRW